MLVYVYDGSFEGLLTCVYEAYYRRQDPVYVKSRENLQNSLTDDYAMIDTDPAKSDRVYISIREKISHEAMQHIYHVFLSEDQDLGTMIYNYLRFGWKVGKKVDLYLADDRVQKIHYISQRVGHEYHRMLGFVRFSQLEGGIYYAPIKPDNNMVELLAPHFTERLRDQSWIIHDVGRDIAALYNKKTFIISEFSVDDIPRSTEEENVYRMLWKEFFDTLAIPSRLNPKLQRQLMPRRYWDYLTEKQPL
jgi:probable DNA metabolism protein